ncbi:MAG TPA: hypothetical protein VJX94_12115, partial [Stellaceae bacterium]|nr:hypothetical protein [Stellaceae bacterium]
MPRSSRLTDHALTTTEALRLRLPGDVSFRRETLTFRDTKNREPRTVPMHDGTARSLRSHLGDQLSDRLRGLRQVAPGRRARDHLVSDSRLAPSLG